MTTTFIDANVFVYAFLKPKRKLEPHEIKIKEAAKNIVTRINEGEETVTSVVHFSQVCNLLEDHLTHEEAFAIEKDLLFQDNISIKAVTEDDYLKALAISEDQQVGTNDALAYVLMKEAGLNKIYSFDRDYDKFKDIARIIE
jgi:predicted nucleic acid-binding protein